MKKTFSVLFITLFLFSGVQLFQANAATEKAAQGNSVDASALYSRIDHLDKEIAEIKKLLVEQSKLMKEIRQLTVPKVMDSNR